MSRVSNALKMMMLIRSKGRVKTIELARLLEVKPRMIQNYKEDIEMCGIHIESHPGKYGGYSISKAYDYLLNLKVSEDELRSLEMGLSQLSTSGFVFEQELERLFNKVRIGYSHCNHSVEISGDVYGSKVQAVDRNHNIEKTYFVKIQGAILAHQKIELQYNALSSKTTEERVIHPYAVYEYRGSLYTTGYCELRQEIRDFKLSRILKLTLCEEQFTTDQKFSLKTYMQNCLGIFKDPSIQVKLLIKHPMSVIVSEKIWAEDQKITSSLDSDNIVFEATMRGRIELMGWILSMGRSCVVLEPAELRDAVSNELKEILDNY